MTILEQSQNLKWIWNKVSIKLGDAKVWQLKSIQQTLKQFPNSTWFGISSEAWNKAINNILLTKKYK